MKVDKIRICACGYICDEVLKGRPKICPECGEKTIVIQASDLHCRYCKKLFSQKEYKKPSDFNLEKKTYFCGCKGWN